MESLLLVGWLPTVKACAGGVCKTVAEIPVASESACNVRRDHILHLTPETPADLWGFPDAKSVDVKTACEPLKGNLAPV